MGSQRGSPGIRTIGGEKYSLYKEYSLIDGESTQKNDASRLKMEGWKVKSITTKKGARIIDRAIYIRR